MEEPPDHAALTSRSVDLLLAEVCRLHYARIRSEMQRLGLHRGQPRLLRLLWEREGRTHSELARSLHVQPATTTKMIQRMEKAGFVYRAADPDDERVSRVMLTEKGRRVEGAVNGILQEIEQDALGEMSDGERGQLRALLERVRDNLLGNGTGDDEQ
jgi:DNA-binding MarR family transcriptional regulator